MILFDFQASFNFAEEIIGYLARFGYSSANSVILVANKIDLERSRVISTEGKTFRVRLQSQRQFQIST